MSASVSPLTLSDALVVSNLAGTIWRHHYARILSIEQIEYMLAQRYQPQLIREQLAIPDVRWRKLVLDDEIIGFSCCMSMKALNKLKIDKLYIHCNHHRKGYGALLIADAVEIMQQNGLSAIHLTVNKGNYIAISAYQRYGFEITSDSVVEIGNGFLMDDYVMTLTNFCHWEMR